MAVRSTLALCHLLTLPAPLESTETAFLLVQILRSPELDVYLRQMSRFDASRLASRLDEPRRYNSLTLVSILCWISTQPVLPSKNTSKNIGRHSFRHSRARLRQMSRLVISNSLTSDPVANSLKIRMTDQGTSQTAGFRWTVGSCPENSSRLRKLLLLISVRFKTHDHCTGINRFRGRASGLA